MYRKFVSKYIFESTNYLLGVLSTTAKLPSKSTYQFYPITVVAEDVSKAVSMVTVLVQVTPNMDWKPQFAKNSYR